MKTPNNKLAVLTTGMRAMRRGQYGITGELFALLCRTVLQNVMQCCAMLLLMPEVLILLRKLPVPCTGSVRWMA
jgi:hypothetical protein